MAEVLSQLGVEQLCSSFVVLVCQTASNMMTCLPSHEHDQNLAMKTASVEKADLTPQILEKVHTDECNPVRELCSAYPC
jgi:hypothetical protein